MRRSTSALSPFTEFGQISGRLARRGFWPGAVLWLVITLAGVQLGNLWLLIVALLLTWPIAAAAARRLHDTDRSAGWLWLGLIPGANLVLVLMLLRAPHHRPSIYDRSSDTPVATALVAAVSILVVILLIFAAPIQVQRANMKPSLMPGDIVLVWRRGGGGWANASCWPASCLTKGGHTPDTGQVIALRQTSGDIAFARMIAGPGDRVQIDQGRVSVNDVPADMTRIGTFQEPFGAQGPDQLLPRCSNGAVGLGAICRKPAYQETLSSGASHVVLDSGLSALDRYGPVVVPDGTVMVLADNRDTPEDSRIAPIAGGLGFVAKSDIVGRTARVLISARGTTPWAIWTWRWSRIMERVE